MQQIINKTDIKEENKGQERGDQEKILKHTHLTVDLGLQYMNNSQKVKV